MRILLLLVSSLVTVSQALTRSINRRTLLTTTTTALITAPLAHAAPPVAIISEELGYFPVTRNDRTVYVPARTKRLSTDQSIALAQHLKDKQIAMIGAYWCPQCRLQKELFGSAAASQLNYVECSVNGFQYAGTKACNTIRAYPTWIDTSSNTVLAEGRLPLSRLAELSGFSNFRPNLETNLPPEMTGSCQLKKAK